MRKIGIITIPDYDNYGNRLQNFAVKHFFSEMGYEVDTLELNDIEFKQYGIRKIKLFIKKIKFRPLIYLFEFINGKLKKVKRYKKFESFTEKYLSVKYHPNGKLKVLEEIANQYDYIVLGSDQIWHPTVMITPNLFFATFADSEKVLFFSPSFGLDQLQDEYAQKLKILLGNKKNVTVREQSGQKIIYDLTGKEARVLPDPTLCVSPDVWKKLAVSFPQVRHKPYVLKYFLGNENKIYKQEFSRICHQYKANIFELAKKESEPGYITGPQEFLGAILNAEYIITDSFHAAVFCIIFNKPFTVFSRLNNMNEKEGLDSRIDDLLKKFHIQNRKFVFNSENEIGEIDSSGFLGILDSIKNNAYDYFEKIIKNERSAT